jgi:hypothetical protein
MRPIMRPVMGPARRAIAAPGFGGSSGLADGASIAFGDVMTVSTAPDWLTNVSAGSKTYRTSGGLIATAGANIARLHTVTAGAGLLSEAGATNLFTYSQQFDNAAYTKAASSVSADAATAADGTTTADKLIENSATSNHYLRRSFVTSATDHVYSYFVNSAGRTQTNISVFSSSTRSVYFDSDAGTFSGPVGSLTYGAIPFANDIWQIWIRSTLGAVTSYFDIYLASSNATSYAGDGSSGAYIWQADCVAASAISSPILTTSGTASRNADSMTIDCTHADLAIPDGDTLRFTATDGTTTSDVVVSSGSVSVPHSSWQAPWETITRIAA